MIRAANAALTGVLLLVSLSPGKAAGQVADTTSVLASEPLGISRAADTAFMQPVMVASAECGRGSSDVALRRVGVAGVFVGGNALLINYMKNAWWSGERSDKFFFRADWDEDFRDQDKFGHAVGGYHLARIGASLLRSACLSKPTAVALSAAHAAAFQLQIEIWDAQFEKYGFSYPDLIANTAGTALAVLHEVLPGTKAIKPTISYAPSAALRNRDNFPGEMRPSLDYSGQTYWLSADVNAMLPAAAKPYWPSFLRVSAGHSITDWIDPETGANIRAKRKILLTIDFDAEKLPGENRLWKTFKRNLSFIHLPSPAIQISPDFEFIPWYK
ncbi:MAG: DUF2279 domain-containing protein [Gemmatimonadaceae bacterium]